ncbi:putative Ig domain-containing protein [Salinibacterium sp. SYSU T00001]|uniref:putative Ig domain-containing protein n=1 Tax=Homoserinimonas sedimenticola TaxID=2986805 RepID=UPI0022367D10|nr:putative Ig domain-containing protein [Salinibacterium sedimenticola]MCW4386312.1 putative Ig domain-containing protein [Salinibacterium sedimenticola]
MTRTPARLALLLSAVLAFTALATPAAASALDEECTGVTGQLEVNGPNSLYGFVGTALAPAPFTTDANGPVTWRGDCAELPPGVTFDQATASYVGTPTSTYQGAAYLYATADTGSAPYEASFEVLPASALQVTALDATGEPLDLSDLPRGVEFELRGAGGLPLGTVATASFDGEELGAADTDDEGRFSIITALPGDVANGSHSLTIDFQMPGSPQQYGTELPVTVRVLSLSGPTQLTPLAGKAVTYSFPANGASGDVSYELHGTLPNGLVFNSTRGTISGTASAAAPSRSLQITATDARGTVTLEVSLEVLASKVTTPTFGGLVTPTLGLGVDLNTFVNRGTSPEDALDELAEKSRPSGPMDLNIGVDPTTGMPMFMLTPPGGVLDADSAPTTPKSPQLVLGTENATLAQELENMRKAAQTEAEQQRQQALAAMQEAARQRELQKQKELEARQAELQNQVLQAIQAKQEQAQAQQQERKAKAQADAAAKAQEVADKIAAAAEQRKELLKNQPEPKPLPVGTIVKVELHSTPVLLGSTVVGASGGFALAVSPPANVPPGQHHLVVTYTLPDGTVHTDSMSVTVLAPDALVPAAVLPATGPSEAGVLTGGALALLLVGLGLARMSRRMSRA